VAWSPKEKDPQALGVTRQSLLAEVRRQTEQLRRRAERGGIFARLAPDGLAKAELQRYLQLSSSAEAPYECLILLACAVHSGAVISVDVLEKCGKLSDRSGDPALRALYLTCARRVVPAKRTLRESSDD
jgi:hypothetical protein